MKQAAASPLIHVRDLQVGMFVHLDGGWLSHPFPLSSFKIASPDQILTIQSLGVDQLSWSPERSDLMALDSEPAPWDAQAETTLRQQESARTVPIDTARQRKQHAAMLASQHAAQQHCERQFSDASQALRRACSMVQAHPHAARQQCEILAQGLTTQMLGKDELCIRLLSENAGERSSTHALNVTVIALLMGKALELPASDMMDLGLGAMLHDIGKIDLPDRVRSHDEEFTSAELHMYQEHVTCGMAHALRMGLSEPAIAVIAQHHEQLDGAGFPAQLHPDQMTCLARIVALSNRYDNLCNPASPSHTLTPHEAISLIFAQSRNRFDATVLNAFIHMMGVYPPGSLVQLTDGRHALVVSVDPSHPLKPRVLAYEPSVPREEALLLNLEEVAGIGIRRSQKAQQLPVAVLEYLAPSQRTTYFFEPIMAVSQAHPSTW